MFDRNAYMKEYKVTHPEYAARVRQYNQEYLETYRTPYMKDYRVKNGDRIRNNERIRYSKTRLAAIAILGGICPCGEFENEFLTVDHVNNDGATEKKHHKQIFADIAAGRADLTRFQILCRNCNDARELIRKTDVESVNSKTKIRVIEFLGSACTCCNESDFFKLTVDHVRNDGNRTDLPRSGRRLYLKIINGQAAREEFQLLCWNCNFSKHLGGGACVHHRRKEQVGTLNGF